ncbi:adenine-specific DNA methyltransferase [Campylobacter iguaniorum]|uniref:site-specific DNA-methyltransferase (adenine-specific) n=1 Tax=Campylobacter iguaniorum TaxID=1244531 RepID=A0A076F8T1_9BACT|nr:DNA adenine methylase [Campylobacter iguaniorum]AII14108.1 adenine-specific DNA methyltransferase [Campylobacter iguaniorum]ALV23847.1 adenine-specific DNA methyltransferase [Campylobacter iguaniorum]
MREFELKNRRYIGSKAKLLDFIKSQILDIKFDSFADIFAGTGVVSEFIIKDTDAKTIIINDFLYSNQTIYNAFFNQSNFNKDKLAKISNYFNSIKNLEENYFSLNFGNKFFSQNDAKKIGFIRENLDNLELNDKERSIILASLIYSCDRVANTVGHFEAYRKKVQFNDCFKFELIKPISTKKNIIIYQKDSNELAKEIKADLIFIDPPYNSRQYSRFYHIYENLAQWKKPELFGIALKPKEQNMSEYCRSNAPKILDDLIQNLNTKFIALTYNNTYNSKSSSSKNKISYDQIVEILSKKGDLSIKEQTHIFFNAGKTDFGNHKEFLFLVKVKN